MVTQSRDPLTLSSPTTGELGRAAGDDNRYLVVTGQGEQRRGDRRSPGCTARGARRIRSRLEFIDEPAPAYFLTGFLAPLGRIERYAARLAPPRRSSAAKGLEWSPVVRIAGCVRDVPEGADKIERRHRGNQPWWPAAPGSWALDPHTGVASRAWSRRRHISVPWTPRRPRVLSSSSSRNLSRTLPRRPARRALAKVGPVVPRLRGVAGALPLRARRTEDDVRRGADADGNRPTVYGYGGQHQLIALVRPSGAWLKGRYAVANLRGGEWRVRHEASSASRTSSTITRPPSGRPGLTSPAHLAIEGASNGGLPWAPPFVQRPTSAFGAGGRYARLFTVGRFWIPARIVRAIRSSGSLRHSPPNTEGWRPATFVLTGIPTTGSPRDGAAAARPRAQGPRAHPSASRPGGHGAGSPCRGHRRGRKLRFLN